MHNIELILTLAAGFSAALLLGYLTHRLGWSPIVGYLLAGILVGPQTRGSSLTVILRSSLPKSV